MRQSPWSSRCSPSKCCRHSSDGGRSQIRMAPLSARSPRGAWITSSPVTRLYGGTRQRTRSLGASAPIVSAQLVSQRIFERREREGEPDLLQAGRSCQLARQEQFVGKVSRG